MKNLNKKYLLFIFIFLILIIIILLFLRFDLGKKYFEIKKENKTDLVNEENKTDLVSVKVFYPKQGEKIKSPLKIIGQAKGTWFFEATFPIILTDWDGKIISEGYAQTANDWMTTDFVPFEADLVFKSPVFPNADQNHFSRRGFLIFKKNNPSGLVEFDDFLEMQIEFE